MSHPNTGPIVSTNSLEADFAHRTDFVNAHYPLPAYHPHMLNAFPATTFREAYRQLYSDKILWLVASWDMYSDEFIRCLENHAQSEKVWIRLDLGGYKGLENLFANVNDCSGFSLQEFCAILARNAHHGVLIDNVPADSRVSSKSVIDEVLSITHYIKEMVPGIHIVVRSRALSPRVPVLPVILFALDEPDCNKFTLSHPLGNLVPEAAMASGEIHRMSNGRPGVINQLLTKLSYTPFMDLVNETSEMAVNNVNVEDFSPSLISAIDRLQNSSNEDLFQLVSCLSVFPYGEDITQLKYFRNDRPFYPVQTGQLVNMGLLEAITHSFFEREKVELPKIVNAIRPAQLYVRHLSLETYNTLTEQAIGLYFGNDWRIKNYKLGAGFSQNKLNGFEYFSLNANTLLRRFFNDSLTPKMAHNLQDSLGLLSHYTKKLDGSCNHRQLCNLCYFIVPKLKENIEHRLAQDILFRYTNSLRMLKNFDEALELYEYLLDAENQTRQRRASIYLNIALTHDEKDNISEAVRFAKKAKEESDKKNATFQHAEAVIIGRSNSKRKVIKLQTLNRACLRDSHYITANTIEIRMAAYHDAVSKKNIYLRMANRAWKENDIFNYVKSTIYYANLAIKQGDKLSKAMITNLRGCYDFARGQRMSALLYSAHTSLWHILHEHGELADLARLFSLTSITYRLVHDEDTELKYLRLLVASGVLGAAILEEDRRYIIERMHIYSIKSPELEHGSSLLN